MRRTLIPTLAMVGSMVPAVARADGGSGPVTRGVSFDVEAFAGGHYFKNSTNLGVAAAPDATEGARSNALAGIRAGLGLSAWSMAEVEILGMITSDRTYGRRAEILGYRLNLLAYLLPGNLRPYLLVGAGVMQVVATRADGTAGMVRDRDGEFHVGGGLDYRLQDHLAVRFDARAVEMPGKQDASLSPDLEATLAAVFVFGAGPRSTGSASPAAALPDGPAPSVSVSAPLSPALPSPTQAPAPPLSGPAPADVVPTARDVPAPPSVQPPVPSIKELLGRAKEIKFEGSSDKLSLASLPLIEQLAEALGSEPGVGLEIVAHTAASGNPGKDRSLSKRRGEAVQRALVDREVAPARLTVTARGADEPLAPNVTRTGRRLNQRIELRLVVLDKAAR